MAIKFRPYQSAAIRDARSSIASGARRLILRAPTGAGKTLIACGIIESAVEKGRRVLFIAHRRELIDQASAKLDEFGLDHGIVMAQHWRRRPGALVQVASIQTLARRELPAADLIIVDEAHLSLAKSYVDLVAAYPSAVVLGLTATPIRHDGKPLSDLYQDIVHVSDVAQLIRMGYLVRPRHYAPERPDLTAIGVRGGDYAEDALAQAMDKPDLVGNIVQHWRALALGRTTAVFAVNIEHSQHIVGQFLAAGIRAEHVDGTTPKWQRAEILRRFASGETLVVSNVGIFTEGYDNQRISAVILARPTLSLALYLQMAGRGLRTFPDKSDCIILDHSGCAHAHGFVDEEREWSLEGKKKSTGSKRIAPVRTCSQCYAAYPVSVRACPECGCVPESAPSEIVEDASVELVEMSEERIAQLRRSRVKEEAQAQTLAELQALAAARGYKQGWAIKRWQARQHRGGSRK